MQHVRINRLCFLFVLIAFASACALRGQTASDVHLTLAEQYLLAAANQERASNGLPPVRLDPVLTAASVYHAREMAAHEDISHQFPNEPELARRGAAAGVRFSLITENVGEAPTSVIIHELWMHSPGHRANLLDPNVNAIGIAIVPRGNELYAVEDFASTVETLSLSQQEQAINSILSSTGLQLIDNIEDARETCAMPSGHAGSRQPWYIMRYTASSLDSIPSQLRARIESGKYRHAVVGACSGDHASPFSSYNIAVLLYP
jgi:hypothetical protein